MVRTTIACAPCRKLKIKCVHDGSPPCRTCLKKGRVRDGQCVLTLPELGPKSSTSTRQPRPSRRLRDGSSHASPHHSEPALGEGQSQTGADRNGTPLVVKGGISAVIFVFSRKFPELRFMHEPTFIKSLGRFDATPLDQAPNHGSNAARSDDRLLYSSLVALCLPLMETGDEAAASAEDFANFVRDRISLTEPPNLSLVQALVVLSMYEWGIGCGYRAWTYSGMATRMMQCLAVLTPRSALHGTDLQIYNRTFWSCFIVDRLIFCGKPQPFALCLAEMTTHWPISEEDFAFGDPSRSPHRTDEEQGLIQHMQSDMNHYYGILVRGFDIWARVLKWIVSGGRRLPGMSLPQNHPWVELSPWRLLYDELQGWREHQERRLHYVEGFPKKHAALGQAEAFGYLNLIYYISLIFLTREYIPFLPNAESEPSGPVDPPLLSEPAPPSWWRDRAADLFTSSEKIPALLQELKDANASLNTPFAGFCAFSAATMNLYVSSFPNMNLKRSADTSFDVLVLNLRLLDTFRAIWPMGEGWWVTIQHCKRLYEHASRDAAGFRTRTRDDFVALEYSIHDTRGQPPTTSEEEMPAPDEQVDESLVDQPENAGSGIHGDDARHAAPQSLQEVFEPYQESTGQLAETWTEQVSGDWWQSWPLWGDQQNIPYAVEGVPFDYIMDELGE